MFPVLRIFCVHCILPETVHPFLCFKGETHDMHYNMSYVWHLDLLLRINPTFWKQEQLLDVFLVHLTKLCYCILGDLEMHHGMYTKAVSNMSTFCRSIFVLVSNFFWQYLQNWYGFVLEIFNTIFSIILPHTPCTKKAALLWHQCSFGLKWHKLCATFGTKSIISLSLTL